MNDYFQILSEVAPEFWTSPAMLAMVFVFGSIWGSFLNVCVYRIPRAISVVTPGSHCGSCASPVAWYDNLPILSWFILRGRCRKCHATFSFRYPLIEALTGAVFLLTWIYFGPSWLTLAYWLFLFGLLVGTFIDFEFYILPDRITLGGMVIGLVASVLVPALHEAGPDERLLALTRSAIGLGLGWGVLYLVRVMGELAFRKEAMGLGDVKLLGAIGAFIGWQGVLFTLIASFSSPNCSNSPILPSSCRFLSRSASIWRSVIEIVRPACGCGTTTLAIRSMWSSKNRGLSRR